MTMAAAEARYETSQPASFSLFTIGSLDGCEEMTSVRIPSLLVTHRTDVLSGVDEVVACGYEPAW